jgi:hypothetical protein
VVTPISHVNPAAALEAAAASAVVTPASPLAGLQPGAVIAARVLALLENGQVQLAIGNALIEATTQVPLSLGATVQLAVQSTGNGTSLQLIGQIASQTVTAEGPPGAVISQPVAVAIAVPAVGEAADDTGAAATGAAPVVPVNATAAVTEATPLAAPPALPVAAAPSLAPGPAADAALALQAAVQKAAAAQNSLAPLFAEIAAAVNLPALPEPVQREAMRLMSLRPQLDGNLTADDVKQAFANSGLFLEAQLAESAQSSTGEMASASTAPNAAAAVPAEAAAVLPADDLKAALIVFRQVLATAVAEGEGAETTPPAPAPVATAAAPALSRLDPSAAPGPRAPPVLPPPPFRDGPTSAQPPAAATIDAATAPREAIQTLMAATDGALARQTLLQAASLPGQPASHPDSGGPRWNFEVPFATPQGAQVVTNVAQFEISRDGNAATPVDGTGPVWRARFSIDIDPIGRVHAQIALRGARAAVTLWAESPQGAARLRAGATNLTDALRAAELEPGDLVVRDGAPRPPAMAAGHFLDRAS